ncbi:glutamate-cysteine ligase family protein [Mycobacterium lepromatosis]|uniref:glutamate-cysteine ligase family protein n=1 Tax=Mycobacterium lepromatosis TaxID=480418 RepID=UPI000678581A
MLAMMTSVTWVQVNVDAGTQATWVVQMWLVHALGPTTIVIVANFPIVWWGILWPLLQPAPRCRL